MNARSKNVLYWVLLFGQSVAALNLLWIVLPIFLQLVSHLGEQQDLSVANQFAVTTIASMLHILYWTRLCYIPMVRMRRNIVLSHLCSFASRLSFFFGGALFTAVFFRHLPELDVFPSVGQALVKAVYIIAVLFGLFCFSLELERLAKAFDASLSNEYQDP